MKHLTDEQLIEHYFAEGANRLLVETHLRICSRCEQVYEEISNTLSVPAPQPPAREGGYGKQIWKSIEARVAPYPKRSKNGFFPWSRLVFAGACFLGLAAAFFVGARWQRSHTSSSEAASSSQAKERVVLFVLDDHLDRSERLLVELSHANELSSDPDHSLQLEARQLLPDNRIYRQALSNTTDPMMAATLDHLERVLLEMANSPDELSSADLARIEREMNTESLLFQIRVLRARTAQRQPRELKKGASI